MSKELGRREFLRNAFLGAVSLSRGASGFVSPESVLPFVPPKEPIPGVGVDELKKLNLLSQEERDLAGSRVHFVRELLEENFHPDVLGPGSLTSLIPLKIHPYPYVDKYGANKRHADIWSIAPKAAAISTVTRRKVDSPGILGGIYVTNRYVMDNLLHSRINTGVFLWNLYSTSIDKGRVREKRFPVETHDALYQFLHESNFLELPDNLSWSRSDTVGKPYYGVERLGLMANGRTEDDMRYQLYANVHGLVNIDIYNEELSRVTGRS